MKNKKVYIGISAIVLAIICAVVGIFYIKSRSEDVKNAGFAKSNENTKEAMVRTEEMTDENVNENEEKVEEEIVEEKNEEENVVKEEPVVEKTTVENKTETKKVEQAPKKEFTVTDSQKTMYVTATSLNVRSGPETTYSRIGALKNSAEVSVTGVVDGFGWYRISYNGKVGYVDGTYLSDTKPVVETTTTVSTEPTSSVSSENALIVINSRNNTLRYYVNGKLSRSYSCATGKAS